MDNRERLLTALAALVEVVEEVQDTDLDGPIALLCACGAAIAGYAEEELIEAVRPIIDRLTAENAPELWAAIEHVRRANNAANN